MRERQAEPRQKRYIVYPGWPDLNWSFSHGDILSRVSDFLQHFRVRTAEVGVRTAKVVVRAAKVGVRAAEVGVRTAKVGVRTAKVVVRTDKVGIGTPEVAG